MPKKRFRPEQIIVILRQIDVTAGQGAPIVFQIGCGSHCFAQEPKAIRERGLLRISVFPNAAATLLLEIWRAVMQPRRKVRLVVIGNRRNIAANHFLPPGF